MTKKFTYEELEQRIKELEEAERGLKQSEEALRESEERFSTIFNNNPAAIALTRIEDNRLVEVNEAWQELTVYTHGEAVGREVYDLNLWVNPKQREQLIETMNNKGFAQGEVLIRRKSGEISNVLMTVVIVTLSGGRYLLTMGQDISDRKLAETALRESEIKYRSLFENAIEGFFQSTPSGEFISVNPAFAKIIGYESPEELISNTSDIALQYYVNPRDRTYYHQILQQKGTIENYEFRAKRKDGSPIWVSCSSRAFFDENGKILRYEGILIDINERKLAEEAIRDSEKRFRSLIESAPDGIVVTDENGFITTWNDGAHKIFGFSAAEVIGQPVTLLMPDHYRQAHREGMRRLVATSEKKLIGKTIELEGLRKDKTVFPLELSLSTWMLMENRFFAAIARDITKRKKIESRLQQSQKMESIGNLAGGIAHDFNNILSSVIGFTELALDEVEEGSNVEDYLQDVYAAGERAKDLVKQILTFARQSEEEVKPIQIDIIIKEVLAFIRSSIPASVEIKKQIRSDSFILGNGTQVHQILMNLCTNAAHAMEAKGGLLSVNLKEVVIDRQGHLNKLDLTTGDYVEIAISDTGVGIPPEAIGAIFEPYYTTKGVGEGTGMGLALVHSIVESYGGRVTVESTLGEGTTFTIYLPITKKRRKSNPYVARDIPAGSERILLVDDEEQIVKVNRRMLSNLGYYVISETSSIDALETFRSRPDEFDLVITDMAMPKMTGEILAIELLKIRPEIPIILCTGFSKNMSVEKASEIGIKAFIHKPIVKADLTKTIRKVLDEAKSMIGKVISNT